MPEGRALVRVIQASLREHIVRVRLGRRCSREAARSRARHRTSRSPLAPGLPCRRESAAASLGVSLRADTTHTLVVLDGPGHLRITNLEDAAGSQAQPGGGAATGLGGTAPGQPLPAALAGPDLRRRHAGRGRARRHRRHRHGPPPPPRRAHAVARRCSPAAGRPRRSSGPGPAWPLSRPGRPAGAVPRRDAAGPAATRAPPAGPAAAIPWPGTTDRSRRLSG